MAAPRRAALHPDALSPWYDVVGAGAAGSVLAARLSGGSDRSVPLLEAGSVFAEELSHPEVLRDERTFPQQHPWRCDGYHDAILDPILFAHRPDARRRDGRRCADRRPDVAAMPAAARPPACPIAQQRIRAARPDVLLW